MRSSNTSFISSLVGGDISLKPCPKGNHREAHALQILHHLHGSPAVEGDLPDVEPLTQPLDELFDVAVVDYISLRGLEVTLPPQTS